MSGEARLRSILYQLLRNSRLVFANDPEPYHMVGGVIHIHGKIRGIAFQTAIIPKEGVYFIPLKDAVRKALKIELNDRVTVEFDLGKE